MVSDFFWCLFLMNMLEFSVDVARGANIFLYFTPKVTFSCYVLINKYNFFWVWPAAPKIEFFTLFFFWDARRRKKLKHFGPKTMRIIKNDK